MSCFWRSLLISVVDHTVVILNGFNCYIWLFVSIQLAMKINQFFNFTTNIWIFSLKGPSQNHPRNCLTPRYFAVVLGRKRLLIIVLDYHRTLLNSWVWWQSSFNLVVLKAYYKSERFLCWSMIMNAATCLIAKLSPFKHFDILINWTIVLHRTPSKWALVRL